MIERTRTPRAETKIAAVSSLLFCLCKQRDLSISPGPAVSPLFGGQLMNAGSRQSLAFPGPSAWAPTGEAPEMVLLMNEFLNFITYHPDTAEWNGPRRAAKGITSHVF
jgi:hypothetical protein